MASDNRFISLFSGAGGLDLGLETAGWNCAYASDIEGAAVETMKANRGQRFGTVVAFENTYIEKADVTKLDWRELLARASAVRGDISLLAGGPPCQSWSSAGNQKGFEDPRGRLFDDFVRLAKGIDARWLLLENVRGLLTARGPDGIPGSALSAIRQKLLHAGYQTAVGLINAADFGVPQRRVRLFMIGFRAGDVPAFPAPTHFKNGEPRWATLREALSTISPLSNTEIIRPNARLATLLADIAPGSGLKSLGKSEKTRPGGHWGYRQGCFVADLDQAARTVTASGQQDWVRDDLLGLRRLAPRECASLQGFPPEWQFVGNTLAQYKLIGNAVPPPVARSIGRALSSLRIPADHHDHSELIPLPPQLQYHVQYTKREEAINGPSRRAAPNKRRIQNTAAS